MQTSTFKHHLFTVSMEKPGRALFENGATGMSLSGEAKDSISTDASSHGRFGKDAFCSHISKIACVLGALTFLLPLSSIHAATTPKVSDVAHVTKHITTQSGKIRTINVTSLFSGKSQLKKQQKIIVVRPNTNQFNISLKANETTGYKWFLNSYDHHLLKLVGYQYQIPRNDIVGMPGTAIFTFKVEKDFQVAPYTTSVAFEYGQPWHPSSFKFHWVKVISYGQAQSKKQSMDSQRIMMSPISSEDQEKK